MPTPVDKHNPKSPNESSGAAQEPKTEQGESTYDRELDKIASEAAMDFKEKHGLREHYIEQDLRRAILRALTEAKTILAQRAPQILSDDSGTGSSVSSKDSPASVAQGQAGGAGAPR